MADEFRPAPPATILRESLLRGIRYIDTAAGYGRAEAAVIEQSGSIRRQAVRVCTKLTEDILVYRVEETIWTFRPVEIDTLLIHSATPRALTNPGIVETLIRAKERRWVRRIGASTYGVDTAALALSQPWCDVVQVEHSLLNPSVLRAVNTIKRPHQEIVARSILCQGLLTDRRAFASHIEPECVSLIDRIASLADSWGISLPELAIRYALDSPGVDVVIVGLSRIDEIETAIASQRRPSLSEEQLDSLAEFNCSDQDWVHPQRWAVAR